MADLDALPGRLGPVFERFPRIAVAYLFGSIARGDDRPESDADVGIVLRARGGTALDHYWMMADLATRLEAFFPGRAVDVVLLEPQGPVFCHNVLLEGCLIYEADSDRRVDFESDTMVRAFDERPRSEWADRVYLQCLKARLEKERP